MKKLTSLATACWLLLAAAAFAQNTGPSPLQNLQKEHPRILLLKGEEAALQRQIKAHPEWAAVQKEVLAECDKMIALSPVERIKIGKRLLDKSRECLRRVFFLSYAYRTTGDEKYFERAQKELLAVAAFEDWNPTHFLDVAEMTMAVAIGYDWLYDKLSEQSRAALENAIVTKGIEPSMDKKYNWFLTAEHNWNQVCNAGIAFGALAIADKNRELAEKIIARSNESIPKAMHYSYNPDGAYPEGFSYWNYGTSFNVLYLSALEKATGSDFGLSKSPGFLKTAAYMQNMVGPTGMAHNWGDSGLKEGLNPAMFWFASKTNNASLLWEQKALMGKVSAGNMGNRILPAMMIWGAKTDLAKINAPKEKMFIGQGPSPVALMRTSWADPNAVFVGVKAGSPSVNHAHMDVGSFVIDAQGERWAMDFGMQNYNSLESKGVDLWNRSQNSERWEVFRLNNFAHNTLSFNSQLSNAKGYAKIDSWGESKDRTAIITGLSQMYEGQVNAARRGISIEQGKQVLVRDEIKTGGQPTTMRWNLLTGAEVKIKDGKTVELTQKGKTIQLIFDASVPISIKTWPTTPTHDYDAENPGTTFVGFEASIPANTAAHFSAWFSPTSQVPQSASLESWNLKSK